MNATAMMLSQSDLAEFGVPWGYTTDATQPGEWIKIDSDEELRDNSLDRLGRFFHRGLQDGRVSVTPRGKFDTAGQTHTRAADAAAEVFWTNALEQTLSSIVRAPKSTNLMVGNPSILPKQSTLRPGQIAGVYDVETTTGQAAWVEPDGARKLPQVGEASERKRYSAGWCGVGYGVGLVEMWQAAELGRPVEQMRRNTAMSALDRFCERVLLYGDAGHQMNGLLGNSQAYQVSLGGNMLSLIADPTGALLKLQIIEKTFNTIAETYGGRITGGIAPMDDLRVIQRMRWSNGDAVWPDFLAMLPWLGLIQWVEHIEEGPDSTGPAWTLLCEDANELWSEIMPAPMLFGPWTDSNTALRTSWGLIRQLAGVISRRRERQARFQFNT